MTIAYYVDKIQTFNFHPKKYNRRYIVIPKHEHMCDICYSNKQYFVRCKRCRKSHCTDCSYRILKCPFCREKLNEIVFK